MKKLRGPRCPNCDKRMKRRRVWRIGDTQNCDCSTLAEVVSVNPVVFSFTRGAEVARRQNQKQRKPNGKAVLYIRNIPAEEKNAFKSWCARRELTLEKGVRRVMKEAVRKDGDADA